MKRTTNLNSVADAVRTFFKQRGFEETITPVVVPAPIPEPTIEAFKVDGGFLRTSPEPQMKRLLADGARKIFQLGPCFRKNETGRLHRTEFTMLEWYETGADYKTMLDFTRKLLAYVAKSTIGATAVEVSGTCVKLDSDWAVMTVAEAFAKFADANSAKAVEDGRFEELLVEKVEPALRGYDDPVALIDYPAELAALARLKPGDPTVAERWELYVGGIELANTYTELTDYDEHLRRFAKFADERQALGMTEYPDDPEFIDALRRGLPECAGCALGMDRLVMLLNSENSIHNA